MRCACGTHELTTAERDALPRKDGKTFCFANCIASEQERAYRWKQTQKRLGFSFDVVADYEDIDVAELEGA